jgi:type VI secretion system secreted protein VgrG
MPFEQTGRLISIDTPLGEDKLLLERYTGSEAMSRLFHFNADLLSADYINFQDIVGQPVTITVNHPDGPRRYINGIVSRFEFKEKRDRFHHYRAEVVPWLWLLTQAANCRIFQNKTAVDVIKKVFDDLGFKDYKDSTQRTYTSREYCVQYRETDFAFVSRLMEEEGIFYFFQHQDGKHTLVMADSHDTNVPCPNQAQAKFERTRGTLELDEDVVTAITTHQELRSGKYSSTDYNFETPQTSLLSTSPTTVSVGGNGRFEVYDYPGLYMKKDLGSTRTDIRMQEIESDHLVASGESHCRAFLPGYRFELINHPVDALNTTYLLAEVNSRASVGTAYAENEANRNVDPGGYDNSFTAIPYSVPYRPRRVTQRSIVEGPHVAVVVGPGGEEIYADKYGRVKVQFFWDREGQKNESSSCWVRVSQAWAGDKFGAMWIPRIGQEVIVSYLEGDPDQPVITGRVYNAQNMPPYDLPDHHTVSTFKSRSSKGGGADDFNEIRFEDKTGHEQLFLQAQKNMHVNVKANLAESVGGSAYQSVGDSLNQDVAKNVALSVGDNASHTVSKNLTETIGMSATRTIGASYQETIGANLILTVGGETHITSGATVVIEAGAQLTLRGPGGFIDIGPKGVSIQGTMVLINSGGVGATAKKAQTETAKTPDPPKIKFKP